MICEKCGTENMEGSRFCKKCGEDFAPPVEPIEEDIIIGPTEVVTSEPVKVEDFEEERERTSPLAVRMKENRLREDKKIQKKLKRGKVWATIAIIMIIVFALENTGIVLYNMGALDSILGIEKEEPIVADPVVVPEVKELTTADLSGEWKYTYRLVKNWDSDLSGDYETITEIIESEGMAVFTDKGENHMGVVVNTGTMKVDGQDQILGPTPEEFEGWLSKGNVGIQMKGTEQKYFAPGGAEKLVISFPVSEENLSGTYTETYDRFVSDMYMRYEITISFEKVN